MEVLSKVLGKDLLPGWAKPLILTGPPAVAAAV